MRLRKGRVALGTALTIFLVLCMASSAPAQEQPEEVPPEVSLERALIERGGLLLPPGQLEIEPALDYSFFSTRRISVSGFSILPSLIIGAIETEKVQRNVLDPSVTLRLGLLKDVQVEGRVPARYIHDRVSTGERETTTGDFGIGDIEAAISYQPLKERGWIPDLILGVRGKSRTGNDPFGEDPDEPPTGTGFYSVTGTVTAVKSSDPAAIFGALVYTHNFDRTVRINRTDPFKTEIDPGSTIGYNVGIALAISVDLSFNVRLEQRFTDRTVLDSRAPGVGKQRVFGSTLNVAQGLFGITWRLTRNTSADFSVGFGLTEDSPDVTVRVAFPIRFSLF